MIVVVERSPASCAVSMHLEPLLGRDLVRAEDPPHLVVEDLRGRAWERGEPGVAQAREVVGEREAERRGALPDLERGERVHVQVGQLALDRLARARRSSRP